MQHIGFIMDGNRRWAKKLNNIASFGHKQGGDNVEPVLHMCLAAGIEYVSMWALSKENITERSEFELTAIFGLIRYKIPRVLPSLIASSIRFEAIGDLSLLPDDIQTILADAKEATAAGTKMTFSLVLGYSGQDEIVRGVKRCIAEWVDPATLNEKEFLKYIDTGVFPAPDLIVRTGGNIRHSWYFLYQSAYSEYYFTETLWPDFDQSEFDRAVAYYDGIKRNFGK